MGKDFTKQISIDDVEIDQALYEAAIKACRTEDCVEFTVYPDERITVGHGADENGIPYDIDLDKELVTISFPDGSKYEMGKAKE